MEEFGVMGGCGGGMGGGWGGWGSIRYRFCIYIHPRLLEEIPLFLLRSRVFVPSYSPLSLLVCMYVDLHLGYFVGRWE